MSDAAPSPSQLVTELKVSAHLMQLNAGIYCVYFANGSAPPDPNTGLPGVRLAPSPGADGEAIEISGFDESGWLGAVDSAALVRVSAGTAHMLMTIYQDAGAGREAPRIQVSKLLDVASGAAAQNQEVGEAVPLPPAPAAVPSGAAAAEAEIAAHLQVHGDVLGRLGDWVGEPGSKLWVEGFAVSPRHTDIHPQDIEYQAVLGRGWLSPWAEGGQYCGSRGMALPILGLRARLRGQAAEAYTLEINATFTDGTEIGPVGPGEACEAESLAPLEAFCITAVPAAVQRSEPAGMRVAPGSATTRRPVAVPKPKPSPRPASPAEPPARVATPPKPIRGRRS